MCLTCTANKTVTIILTIINPITINTLIMLSIDLSINEFTYRLETTVRQYTYIHAIMSVYRTQNTGIYTKYRELLRLKI